MSTSVLSSLKVIARPKIEPKPPVIGKRLKLIERLEQQKEMAQCLIDNKRFEAFKERKLRTLKQVKSPLSADPPLFDRGITIATNTTILK